MSALVWNQLIFGKRLHAPQRRSATVVVEALVGRARSENIIGRSQDVFGDIALTSVDSLLSVPRIGCPGSIQSEPARKGEVAAEMAGGDRFVLKVYQAAQRPPRSVL
ncbi:hypothetical protein [Bradyrhizobium sp. USDA 4473]